MQTLPSLAEMERARARRDASYDGIFFIAVRTTGIFCRPSCPARSPLPENIEYFPSAREAVFAGYRPCKRCRPLETNGKPPEWIQNLLRTVESNPTARYSDAYLRSIDIEPSRARRFFMKNYGMTFQAYCRGRRLGRSFEQIRRGDDLDDVALGHGYESHSGFREAFAKTFGTTPGKTGDAGCVVTSWIESPFGPLLAAAKPEGICLLEFTDRRRLEHQFMRLRKYFKCAIVPGENKHIEQLRKELSEYFEGTRTSFTLKLIFPGSPFEEKVWNELLKIPYGATTSYEAIAKKLGSPKSSRAVGRANGFNRISIVIPCHRVINKNGALGGYGGGLWRKKLLLSLEQNRKLP
ncbi:MAG TPA: methylated-DNA--[protein]-cysteine S-methyltransferase [Bacteroidota bacterium]|nr:methylated-DNA--[protein]-cysteine S-methyltransferase [Bacteroidota bacterium]